MSSLAHKVADDDEQRSVARELLLKEVKDEVRWETLYARSCHVSNILLLVLTLAAGAAAAVYGLMKDAKAPVAGFLALVPGGIAVLAGSLKFQAKGHWHYERVFALSGLRRSIEIEMPNPPSRDQLVELSRRLHAIDEELNKKWVDGLSFDWSGLLKRT